MKKRLFALGVSIVVCTQHGHGPTRLILMQMAKKCGLRSVATVLICLKGRRKMWHVEARPDVGHQPVAHRTGTGFPVLGIPAWRFGVVSSRAHPTAP